MLIEVIEAVIGFLCLLIVGIVGFAAPRVLTADDDALVADASRGCRIMGAMMMLVVLILMLGMSPDIDASSYRDALRAAIPFALGIMWAVYLTFAEKFVHLADKNPAYIFAALMVVLLAADLALAGIFSI